MGSSDNCLSFRCLACKSGESCVFASDCRDLYLGFPGAFEYLQCAACGLVQLHPIPHNLAAYYRSYPIHRRKNALFSWLRSRVVAAAYAPPPAMRIKALDFGCGDGWYMQYLQARGHSVLGFEADANHARHLSDQLGAPVYSNAGDLSDHHAGTLDLVTMHFVVEHLPCPSEAFALVSRLLKPGGRWYFVIPSLASLEWRLFGKRWHGFDVPRHISYPEDAHVRMWAERSHLHVDHACPIGSATDFAGSISTVLFGRYTQLAFYAALPCGLLWSRILPGACRYYWLSKQATLA